jgi:hypothetical protein
MRRKIARVAETKSHPRLSIGRGYADTIRQQADLIDTMVRPAFRRGALLSEFYPHQAGLHRSRPVKLNAADGSKLPLVGDLL